MSRKALGTVVGVVGTLAALGTLLGMSLMGSLLADARSEHLMGPGVDLFLRTPFPSPGDEGILEVVARGGERAGIEQVTVRNESQVLAEVTGAGATWGSTIRGSKTRGSESQPVAFRVPERHPAGSGMSLTVEVAYVVAMKGGGGFTNESRRDTVRMTIPVLSPAGRRLARLTLCGLALGLFAIWFLLVWGVAALYARAEIRGGSSADPEFEGIGLLMGLIGGGFLGYWLFARRLMAVWGTQATGWAVLLTAFWVGLPLVWAWRWWKRRSKFERYLCVLPRGEGGVVAATPRDLDPSELTEGLKQLGYHVRCREGALRAAREKARLRTRWSGSRIVVDGLALEATDTRSVLEVVHRISRKVGRLMLQVPTGQRLEIDPIRTVQEIERAYVDAAIAAAQQALARLDALRSLLKKQSGNSPDRAGAPEDRGTV